MMRGRGRGMIPLMGVINASPESFYTKSVASDSRAVSRIALGMQKAGASIIDVGGMSSAPYMRTAVPERTETGRVRDAVRAIRRVSDIPVSVDTCRSGVAAAAIEEGACMINDITGLQHDPLMARVAARHGCALCLCAYSRSMVAASSGTAARLLKKSVSAARRAGVSGDSIVIDPAIGFFRKRGRGELFTRIASSWASRDLEIIGNLAEFSGKYPVLVSVSNKSFLGRITGEDDPARRLAASLAAETASVINGADIIRTHNVADTLKAVRVASGFMRSRQVSV